MDKFTACLHHGQVSVSACPSQLILDWKPIEVHKLPRVRLPLEAVRSVLQGCRPRPTISEVRESYNLTESELRELADEMAPEE